MQNLFGTDGIRGRAGDIPLTPDFVTRIGGAIAAVLSQSVLPNTGDSRGNLAIIGRDTRASGEWIERSLTGGLRAQDCDVLSLGVLPTPGVAYLARCMRARCGISISASHNPYQDNGIKIFGADGFKIPDTIESEIELLAPAQLPSGIQQPLAAAATATNEYEKFLISAARGSILRGKRVVVDCNNGATYELAPRVLRRLGAQVIAVNIEPDGTNINRGYDALEPRLLKETVLRERADWGVQFDGDGDRAIFVDELGNFLDGDFVLAILASDWVERGVMQNRLVVSTVMANMGLERALNRMDVQMERVAVGDRWVTEQMRATGGQIGGEQSGHIVLFDGGHTTGDGIYTAIRIADIIAQKNVPLSELAARMQKDPQVLVNVPVRRKPPLENFPQVQSQVERAKIALGNGARINVRYSGTEDLARVMIEGSDARLIAHEAELIAQTIRDAIT